MGTSTRIRWAASVGATRAPPSAHPRARQAATRPPVRTSRTASRREQDTPFSINPMDNGDYRLRIRTLSIGMGGCASIVTKQDHLDAMAGLEPGVRRHDGQAVCQE